LRFQQDRPVTVHPIKEYRRVPAVVSKGQSVSAGGTVGRVADQQLGADVHASIAGEVIAVTEDYVELRSKG
jgi:hypothetical protein